MTREISDIFENLPTGFYGSVEVHIRNGVPAYAKVTQTHQMNASAPERTPSGEPHERTRTNLIPRQ